MRAGLYLLSVIEVLVADRQRQIVKSVAENYQHICHLCGIWHVANRESNEMQDNLHRHKPLYQIFIVILFPKWSSSCKEAEDNLRTKGMSRPGGVTAKCHQLSPLGSISTTSGDGELIVEKWKSIERHIQNLQRGHGGKLQGCAHSRLRKKYWKERWIKPVPVLPCVFTWWSFY